jgi:hypothetical protein
LTHCSIIIHMFVSMTFMIDTWISMNSTNNEDTCWQILISDRHEILHSYHSNLFNLIGHQHSCVFVVALKIKQKKIPTCNMCLFLLRNTFLNKYRVLICGYCSVNDELFLCWGIHNYNWIDRIVSFWNSP